MWEYKDNIKKLEKYLQNKIVNIMNLNKKLIDALNSNNLIEIKKSLELGAPISYFVFENNEVDTIDTNVLEKIMGDFNYCIDEILYTKKMYKENEIFNTLSQYWLHRDEAHFLLWRLIFFANVNDVNQAKSGLNLLLNVATCMKSESSKWINAMLCNKNKEIQDLYCENFHKMENIDVFFLKIYYDDRINFYFKDIDLDFFKKVFKLVIDKNIRDFFQDDEKYTYEDALDESYLQIYYKLKNTIFGDDEIRGNIDEILNFTISKYQEEIDVEYFELANFYLHYLMYLSFEENKSIKRLSMRRKSLRGVAAHDKKIEETKKEILEMIGELIIKLGANVVLDFLKEFNVDNYFYKNLELFVKITENTDDDRGDSGEIRKI